MAEVWASRIVQACMRLYDAMCAVYNDPLFLMQQAVVKVPRDKLCYIATVTVERTTIAEHLSLQVTLDREDPDNVGTVRPGLFKVIQRDILEAIRVKRPAALLGMDDGEIHSNSLYISLRIMPNTLR